MIQGNGGRAATDTLHRHNSGAGEKALEETGKQAGHAELHGDSSAAHPGGNNCAKCGESAIRSCPGGLRRFRGDPGLSPPGAGAAEPGQGRGFRAGLRAGLRAGSYLRCGGAR